MNKSFTMQSSLIEAARPLIPVGATHSTTSFAEPPQQSGGRRSPSDIAQRILRLTGNVRLASRSAHNWHLCGINE